MIHKAVYPLGKGQIKRLPSMGLWLMCVASALLSFAVHAEVPTASNALVEQGRRIYQEGVLPSGKPLQGQRLSSMEVQGADAACSKCHRKSGMGAYEGNIAVPPITGNFLFATQENRPFALLDINQAKHLTRAHDPYTEASLAKSLRSGVNISGKKMSALMPLYSLSDKEIKALTAYLRQLSEKLSPGVGTDTLHLATIVTPGVEPKQREAMLKMMRTAFTQRNASQENISGRMKMPLDVLPRTLRNWELSVWELQGAPETWGKQLLENYQREPVFAVISGVSVNAWEPVQAFCEQEKLPCLFPSIPLPPKQTAYYSLYYSRGVALEADVLAKHLRDQADKAPHRLVQIYRNDDVGHDAAQALSQALRNTSIQLEDRVLNGQDPKDLTAVLKDIPSTEGVVFWLRPADLSAVNQSATEQAPAVAYVSGFLTGEDFTGLAKSWKPQVRVIYPYDLGKNHQTSVSGLKEWLKTWNIPLVNEAFQTEVYFNLLFLTDLSSQMLDNFYRDYLIERAEDMLSIGSNITIYPRLSLAVGQRFASKGAYIARFEGDKLVAETDWIVP